MSRNFRVIYWAKSRKIGPEKALQGWPGWGKVRQVQIEMAGVDATITAAVTILRREREMRHHSLSEFESNGTRRKISIDRAVTVMGRSDDAFIHLASKRASRHHAFLKLRGNDCVLIDNDSHNGVVLNGVKVHSAVLRDGDVIQVADSVFVYHED